MAYKGSKFRAVSAAIIVHVIFGGFLVFSVDWGELSTETPEVNIIQAEIVDESKINEEIIKLKKAQNKKRLKEERRSREEKRKAEESKRKAREAEIRRLEEEKKLADLKLKRLEEEKQRKKIAIKKKQEQERIEKLKQEQAALKKKREEESKKLAEIELEKELRREAEEDAKIEAKRKKVQEEKQQQLAASKKDKEKRAAEQRALSEIDKYKILIGQKVKGNWLQPTNFSPGLKCTVVVKLIPGGDVVDVRVTRCSTGVDTIFRNSVEKAVQRASPLPVPSDPFIFSKMREIEFVFNPTKE